VDINLTTVKQEVHLPVTKLWT